MTADGKPPPGDGVFPGPYPAPFRRDFARWRAGITREKVDHLRREGWCVVDGFMGGGREGGDGGAWASALRAEIAWLARETDAMRPNRTHFTNPEVRASARSAREDSSAFHRPPSADTFISRPTTNAPRRELYVVDAQGTSRYLFAKPHVFEADLHEAETRRKLPELDAFFHAASAEFVAAFADAFEDAERESDASAAPPDASSPASKREGDAPPHPSPPPPRLFALPRLGSGDARRTVKLQHNRGLGGCFPMHYDNPGAPSRRALTAILYLNPRWAPGDGGELVLAPFCAPGVRIAPTHDRLCVFLSDRVCHRVAPSDAERFCLTVWVDARDETDVNRPEDATLRVAPEERATGADVASLAGRLRVAASQRVLSRAVHREQYERSLRECMRSAPREQMEAMLEAHAKALREVEANEALAGVVRRLRMHKEEAEFVAGGECRSYDDDA